MVDRDWVLRAECRNARVEWFVSEAGSRKGEISPQMRRALYLCARCPVQRECLEDELDFENWTVHLRPGVDPVVPMPMAIRGGTFPDERHKTKRLARQDRIEALLTLAQARYTRLGLVKKEAS